MRYSAAEGDAPGMFAAIKRLSARERWILAGATAIGMVERGWVAVSNAGFDNGEAGRVARALAAGNGFADALFAGSGPTAHLLPIAPMVGSVFYLLFGSGLAGTVALFVWSVGLTFAAYAIAGFACRAGGLSHRVVIGGFVLLAILPLYSFTEAIRWQAWDGGIATVIAMAILASITRVGRGQRLHSRIGALLALCLFVNPMIGLAAGMPVALAAWRPGGWRGLVGTGAVTALVLAGMMVPWALRNQRALGETVWLRDNAGVELAISMYPEAAVGRGGAGFTERLATVHPSSPEGRKRMHAAGGEVAYSRLLLRQTLAWMAGDPAGATRIAVRHASEMVAPRPWMFARDRYRARAPSADAASRAPTMRALAASLISVLAVGYLLLALLRRRWAMLPLALFVGVLVMLAAPFQIVTRYCWPLYPLFGYLACAMWVSAMRWIAGRREGLA